MVSGIKKYFTAARVIHRLPGRLRIHIPDLERIPPAWEKYTNLAGDLVKIKKGIQSVDIRLLTGNVLISYDAAVTSEADVITWLKTLTKFFLNINGRHRSIPETEIEALLKGMKSVVQVWYKKTFA